jgi:hypothetical protein
VRAISSEFASLLGCVLIASAAGCYVARQDPLDGAVDDGEAGTPDAPRDGGPDAVPLPTCRRSWREWSMDQEVYPGGWARGAARLRHGERTWLAVYSVDTGQTHLLDFAYTGRIPVVLRNLPAGSGVPVAGAMDDARVVLAWVGLEAPLSIRILDPDARFLGELDPIVRGGRPTLSLRGTRAALAQSEGMGVPSSVVVFDVSGAGVIGEAAFEEYEEVAVGHGLGLFYAIGTPPAGESELLGVDEAGVTRAGGIGARMLAVDWDGPVAAGFSAEGGIAVRRPRTAVEQFDLGEPFELRGARLSLATSAGELWFAIRIGDPPRVLLGDPRNGWISLPEEDLGGGLVSLLAHADPTHRGAFVLTARELRWIGFSCSS